ncbi:MAG: hypothetical protein JWR26_260 [Pedosphaera sp.]|nr:hypothetical protein [Pedosphaera sp.]
MKQRAPFHFAAIATLLIVKSMLAEDVFPVFNTAAIEVTIPTNTPGLLPDSTLAVKNGTNIAYHLKGEIFTKATEGQIQFKSQGFSGTSDRSTPWKTLTELFSVYQDGSPEAGLKSLYASSAREALEEIYKNPAAKTHFQNFGLSFTNAQALMWHSDDSGEGMFAYVNVAYRNGHHSVLPFYMVKNGDKYELVSKTIEQNSTNNMHQNISAFLRSSYVTNLIR